MIYTHISNAGYYVALSRKQAEIALQQSHGILHECISSSDCLDLLQREAKSRHAHPHPKSCWESLQAGTISPVSSGLNLVPTPSLCSKVLVRFRFGLMNNWPEPIRTPTT